MVLWPHGPTVDQVLQCAGRIIGGLQLQLDRRYQSQAHGGDCVCTSSVRRCADAGLGAFVDGAIILLIQERTCASHHRAIINCIKDDRCSTATQGTAAANVVVPACGVCVVGARNRKSRCTYKR
jgi:hypothetical protein